MRLIELVKVNEFAVAASAQLFEARYEPDTLIVPEPTVSVPENTAVTEPVGLGQPNRVTPAANVTCGSVANPTPGVVGNWHTATCALVRFIELDNDNELAAADKAQLFAAR